MQPSLEVELRVLKTQESTKELSTFITQETVNSLSPLDNGKHEIVLQCHYFSRRPWHPISRILSRPVVSLESDWPHYSPGEKRGLNFLERFQKSRLKVEELEAERSRLEGEKKSLEVKLDEITLQWACEGHCSSRFAGGELSLRRKVTHPRLPLVNPWLI
uniref:Uncharacterized protein n=1 Tax=Sphaerodactylus townsendi TaxID=933632 RepID=A0ACB8FKN6_9SAUR